MDSLHRYSILLLAVTCMGKTIPQITYKECLRLRDIIFPEITDNVARTLNVNPNYYKIDVKLRPVLEVWYESPYYNIRYVLDYEFTNSCDLIFDKYTDKLSLNLSRNIQQASPISEIPPPTAKIQVSTIPSPAVVKVPQKYQSSTELISKLEIPEVPSPEKTQEITFCLSVTIKFLIGSVILCVIIIMIALYCLLSNNNTNDIEKTYEEIPNIEDYGFNSEKFKKTYEEIPDIDEYGFNRERFKQHHVNTDTRVTDRRQDVVVTNQISDCTMQTLGSGGAWAMGRVPYRPPVCGRAAVTGRLTRFGTGLCTDNTSTPPSAIVTRPIENIYSCPTSTYTRPKPQNQHIENLYVEPYVCHKPLNNLKM